MMKRFSFNESRLFFALPLVVISILIYSLNLHQIVYQLTPWQDFGNIPIEPVRILNFIEKTDILISYLEPGTSKKFMCKEAVAYLEVEGGEIYRCCNSPERVSCARNDDSHTYLTNKKCEDELSKIFGIPKQLPNTKNYKKFGHCPNSGNPEITVVQISDNQKIFWKSIKTLNLDIATFGLKCFVAPLFISLALWGMMKNTTK